MEDLKDWEDQECRKKRSVDKFRAGAKVLQSMSGTTRTTGECRKWND